MGRAEQLRDPLLARMRLPGRAPVSCIPWAAVFYINVFMACISFSIVMPSLFLYLQGMGANPAFYALVVAAYSIGEALGSVALGALSNVIGTKRTMQTCAMVSCSGALSYALADSCARPSAAVLREAAVGSQLVPPELGPFVVLAGRILQGIGSGGQQAVEQAYLTVAAPYEERTAMTAKLSTFACLGFIFGPALGAVVSQTPAFAIGGVRFDTFTKQGWVVAVLNSCMCMMTTCCFTEVRHEPAQAEAEGEAGGAARRDWGVWACILFFFVHFNGFAVQETITTPLVKDWFGWDAVAANLLFTAAGVGNLLCAVLMSYLSGSRPDGRGGLTQLVGDRTLLVWSSARA